MLARLILPLLLHAIGLYAASIFSPLRPPSIPLAVRSPYLSAWQQAGADGGNGGYLAGQWPTFWRGQVTGWTGMIRVDDSNYVWLGNPAVTSPLVEQVAFEYTSTRSIFTMNVGSKVGMNVTFLSPVEPDDLLRASLPYSYLEISVYSLDSAQHNVSVYTDISAEWVSGNRSATAQWEFDVVSNITQSSDHASTESARRRSNRQTTLRDISRPELASGIAYHKLWRQEQLLFSEVNEQTEYGYWYYATESSESLTYQSGTDTAVREQFVANGSLANTNDTNYRAISNAYPVFAFAVDLGAIGTLAQSTYFQLSLHQQQAVQFLGANGTQILPSLWTSYFATDVEALSFFYNDYSKAVTRADALDQKIAIDSIASAGQQYAGLTALATRQAFGSLEWTNTPTEPLVFMKEISSDGNVNTVDVIFPFHPIAIYLNPKILKYLLDPLFINQESGNWPQTYTIHDIGSAFPNATGHPDGKAEDQPLEECGNMLIMTLAYAQRSNDSAYLSQHYNILKQWTGYLVNDSLIPANQISTDDFAGSLANQTNLALKGMIGIEAFAQIANRTGQVVDGVNYTQIAHSYIDQWQSLGIASTASPPHTTLAYGENDTHGLLYNLYADRELGLQLVPQSVYDMQSSFYPTVINQYGVPLDTRHTYTKADWELYVAAIASNTTRDLLISTIATWLGKTTTAYAWSDLYETVTGGFPSSPMFINRPVIGGIFAPLALDSAPAAANGT
ncbi:hypothetical protein AMS68_005821 [Peltaster fructicola]|uniref:Glutaminase A n=1 Tax=Peltaster fructicola TaxID=286661 RepID=A0A6H0XZY2_9PEZI|nr:hypothetical protein AMS68_005821 [Peltaster fructicola]